MALRLGIGDVFTLCKGAVDICTTLPHQSIHKESSLITAEMQLMRSHLQNLEAQIGDQDAYLARHPEMASIITHSLQPLHRDLTDLKELMRQHETQHQDCVARKQSVHVVDQVRRLVLYQAKLKGFRDKLPTHRESVCVIRELMSGSESADGGGDVDRDGDTGWEGERERMRRRKESVVRLEELRDVYNDKVRRVDEDLVAKGEVLRVWEEGLGSNMDGDEDGRSGSTEGVVGNDRERKRAEEEVCEVVKKVLMQDTPVMIDGGEKKPEFKLDVFN